MPAAVIFDLDGVLLDSEQLWNKAKEELVRAEGGEWSDDAPRAMMGMSSTEWSAYMHDQLGVALPAEQINDRVVGGLEHLYRERLPLLPGAVDLVRECARRWPVGLASSSNREIIDLVLSLTDLTQEFVAVVSSEEVERGKPAPDVYVEVARLIGVDPRQCVTLEDSTNGIKAAVAAGMKVIAVPNVHYPPEPGALTLAAATVVVPADVTPSLIERIAGRGVSRPPTDL